MNHLADFTVEGANGDATARLTGDWTSQTVAGVAERLRRALAGRRSVVLDMTGVGRCDTVGAFMVLKAAGGKLAEHAIAASPETLRLMGIVAEASKAKPEPANRSASWLLFMDRVGRGVINVGVDFYGTMAFNGRLLAAAGRAILDPRRLRAAPLFAQAERSGLDALPIVAITSLFIGAVIGLLGAHSLSQFGAQVFAVELIGISVLREFCIIITAVLLAGRSASSFAAEIGSMKMNQEIDAMQVLGVDPFEALVLPRFLAMLITIPLLTFVAAVAGLVGGMLVTWLVLGLSPDFFLRRLIDYVGVKNFWVGLSKAPVMAVVISAIGCRQGMEVGVDVESLGRRVTAAVVHAIFSIIFIDALFALLYMELDI